MMITVLHALALLAPTPGGSTDQSAWLELDREIATLASGAGPAQDDPLSIVYDVIVSYQKSSGDFYDVGGDDVTDAELRRARLTFTGLLGKTRYKISGDLEDGTMELKDAYLAWDCAEACDLIVGRYKNPLLWSGRVSSFADPFHDVQVTAEENNDRGTGVLFECDFGDLAGLVSAQNGVDDVADEMLFVGRVQWDIMGDGAFGQWHGAYGYGGDIQLSVAVSGSDDGGIENGSALAQEVGLVMRPFSLRADSVQYNEEYDEGSGLDPDDTLGTPKADTSPSAITAGYLFGDDRWELLGRWERFDDEAETERKSFGLVWYTSLGPKARWALLYQDFQSDADAFEGDRFELSFSLKSS
jgi:hypothetical protein